MSTKPIVLAINLGWEQQRLIDTLFDEGCDVVGAHADLDDVGERPYRHLERVDPRDLPSILALAQRFKPVTAIADQCDYAHFAAAVVCEAMGLRGPRIREAQVASNKLLNRRAAESAGVRVPAFVPCATPAEAATAADKIGYPVVVKPVDNRGSFGVCVSRDRAAVLDDAITALAHSHSRTVLVERFVKGSSIIVEGYCFPRTGHQSLALGTKRHILSRPQIHTEVVFPGELDASTRARVLRNNDAVAAAMGLRHGMTSAEYVLDEYGEPWLMEMANRGGGVLISSVIVPHVSGVDTTRQLVFDGLGRARDLFEERVDRPQAAAHLAYFVFEPGEVRAVHGLDAMAGADDVLAMRYWGVRQGVVDLPRNALERQGMLITAGATAADARARGQEVRRRLRVDYA